MTLGEKIDKILEEVSGIKPMVDAHNKTLYGNGQKGLTDRVTVIEEKQKSCVALKGHARTTIIFAIQIIMCGIAILSAVVAFTKLPS